MRLNSAYLCVKDMDRAIDFYQWFLDQSVSVKDSLFSIFEFGNFRLCLFNYQKANEKVSYGDNCLLSFEVDDARAEKERLVKKGVKIVYPLKKISNNLVFEFQDSEGNDLEVYSQVK